MKKIADGLVFAFSGPPLFAASDKAMDYGGHHVNPVMLTVFTPGPEYRCRHGNTLRTCALCIEAARKFDEECERANLPDIYADPLPSDPEDRE